MVAEVYKPTRVDPLTGERVRYKHWYIRYHDAEGRLHEVAGLRGKAATLAKAIERSVARAKSGIAAPHPRTLRLSLSQHLEDFRRSLPVKQATTTLPRLRSLLAGGGFYGIAEIRASRVTEWLRDSDGASAASSRDSLRALKQFTAWLRAEGRLAEDLLARRVRVKKNGRTREGRAGRACR